MTTLCKKKDGGHPWATAIFTIFELRRFAQKVWRTPAWKAFGS